jgi:hypothetical protein
MRFVLIISMSLSEILSSVIIIAPTITNCNSYEVYLTNIIFHAILKVESALGTEVIKVFISI